MADWSSSRRSWRAVLPGWRFGVVTCDLQCTTDYPGAQSPYAGASRLPWRRCRRSPLPTERPRIRVRSSPPSIASATAGACSSWRRCSTVRGGSTSCTRRCRDRAEHPVRPAAPPGARGHRARPAVPAATGAHGLRPDRRGAGSRGFAAAPRRLGRPPHRRRGPDPPRAVRHAARSALVLPDLSVVVDEAHASETRVV